MGDQDGGGRSQDVGDGGDSGRGRWGGGGGRSQDAREMRGGGDFEEVGWRLNRGGWWGEKGDFEEGGGAREGRTVRRVILKRWGRGLSRWGGGGGAVERGTLKRLGGGGGVEGGSIEEVVEGEEKWDGHETVSSRYKTERLEREVKYPKWLESRLS